MTRWANRPVVWVLGLAATAGLVLAGLGWVTATALAAEADAEDATRRADRAARERLALWRLDGFVLPFVGRENARAFEDYTAPSPLADEPLPAWMVLHFQLDPRTGWTTPQPRADRLKELADRLPAADGGRMLDAPDRPAVTPPAGGPLPAAPGVALGRVAGGFGGGIGGAGGGIGGVGGVGGGIGGFAEQPALLAGAAAPAPPAPTQVPPPADYAQRQEAASNTANALAADNRRRADPAADTPVRPKDEMNKSAAADAERHRTAARGVALGLNGPAVHVGPVRAVWLPAAGGEVLLLVRPADAGGRRVYQGVWLDWPRLADALAGRVADLLPGAELAPLVAPADSPDRAMTVLPAALLDGPSDPPPGGWTPLRSGLALAWAATLMALGAVAAGGRAVLALADRRVRFVSAVTHELRTPLTSLRLYLDLLAGGLVSDPLQQHEYLVTLRGEADRLHRLIENVLDFARLEGPGVRANCVPAPAADLLAEARDTWADRLAADGKELVVTSTLPPGQAVRTDPRMASQVLANLLDNARKYSRGAADPRVWVWARPAPGNRVAFEVEDRGPGVPAADRAGLFRAFRRGREVEAVAGGAGLGLALAARWATLLGGRLLFRPADGGVGACFRLELPGA